MFITIAVYYKSFRDSLGLEACTNLFIFAASNYQFESPITGIYEFSNNEWRTFNGLEGDFYANPISSNMMQVITLQSLTNFFAWIALSKHLLIP